MDDLLSEFIHDLAVSLATEAYTRFGITADRLPVSPYQFLADNLDTILSTEEPYSPVPAYLALILQNLAEKPAKNPRKKALLQVPTE